MKKVMSMLLAAALCAGVFAGCSGTDTASSAADAASQADAYALSQSPRQILPKGKRAAR